MQLEPHHIEILREWVEETPPRVVRETIVALNEIVERAKRPAQPTIELVRR